MYELETSYDEKHVQELSYAQDKNNLYIAHQKYTPAVLTRNSDNDWVLKTLTLNPTVSTVSAVTIEKTKAKKDTNNEEKQSKKAKDSRENSARNAEKCAEYCKQSF